MRGLDKIFPQVPESMRLWESWDLRFSSVCDVPGNSCRVAQVEDADSPGLHRRRLAHNARVLVGEIEVLDVFPPGVGVLDGEAHHEIARVLGDVEGPAEGSGRSLSGVRRSGRCSS